MDPLRLGTIETNFELKIDEKYTDRNIFSYEEHPELNITMSDLFKNVAFLPTLSFAERLG